MGEAGRFRAVEHRHNRFRGICRGRGGRSGAVAGFPRVRSRGFFRGPDNGAHGRGAWVFARGRSSKHRGGDQHHRNYSEDGAADQDGGAPRRSALSGRAGALLRRARAPPPVGRRCTRARRGGDGPRDGTSLTGVPDVTRAWRRRRTTWHRRRRRSWCTWRRARGGRGRRRRTRGWRGRRGWAVGRRHGGDSGRSALRGCGRGRAERRERRDGWSRRSCGHGRGARLRPRCERTRLPRNGRTSRRRRRLTRYGRRGWDARLCGPSGRARERRSAGG